MPDHPIMPAETRTRSTAINASDFAKSDRQGGNMRMSLAGHARNLANRALRVNKACDGIKVAEIHYRGEDV
jgi:hypothetical protein